MNKTERRFDFIDEKKWNKLSKDQFKLLMSYKGIYSSLLKSERKVEKLKEGISVENKKILDYHRRLTEKNHHIDHLRETYNFGISVVKVGGKYYNMCINRRGQIAKNGSLGLEEVIVDHLLKYYKRKKSPYNSYNYKTDHINDDWISFLKFDDDLYNRIEDMILEDDVKFQNTTLNRHSLFPLDTKSTK